MGSNVQGPITCQLQLADLTFVLRSGLGVTLPIGTRSRVEGGCVDSVFWVWRPKPGGHRELGGREQVELSG